MFAERVVRAIFSKPAAAVLLAILVHTALHLAPQTTEVVTEKNDAASDNSVAFFAIAKDEHLGIVEWVLYHWALGVSKFYIRDDGSNPPMEAVLKPLIEMGLVSYTYAYNDTYPNRQPFYYNDCLHRYRTNYTYLGFLDIDEFLILKGPSTIQELLKPYEDHACLMIPWRHFGSSGHKTAPVAGVLQSYTACEPLNSSELVLGKTITNTKHANHAKTHKCIPYPNTTAISPSFEEFTYDDIEPMIEKAYLRQSDNIAVVYHYRTKSWQEFAHKMEIGDLLPQFNKTLNEWNWIEGMCSETCTDAVALGTLTRQLAAVVGVPWQPSRSLPPGLASRSEE